eukprot:3045864-Rhodomonas_salina.1
MLCLRGRPPSCCRPRRLNRARLRAGGRRPAPARRWNRWGSGRFRARAASDAAAALPAAVRVLPAVPGQPRPAAS